MALIKHSHALDVAKAAVVLDLGDLQRQGQLMIQAARDQAAAIIAEAKAERARIVQGAAEQGHKEGFEQGCRAGLATGTEEGRKTAIADLGPQLQRLEAACLAALAGFEESRASLVFAAERDLMRLALKIAERIVKRRIAADPRIVVDQFRALLEAVLRPTSLIVRVHPADAPTLREALPTIASQVGAARHVEVVEDPGLERGSCVASMRGSAPAAPADPGKAAAGEVAAASPAGGEIDASIGVQLDRLAEALLPGGEPLNP